MNVEVTGLQGVHAVGGCDDCPLQYDWQGCRHPYAPAGEHALWDYTGEGEAPDWCPLRAAPLVLGMRKSADR